ncbi:MAG: hypothetical protein COA78_29035 [Blastopirellula sp.]|nr:MAG: hypothetical protein COA78_29035 [Blastopirellula sp.]
MTISTTDHNLLQLCFDRQEYAWQSFVDRYVGLVTHVVSHTVQTQSLTTLPQEQEQLVIEVFRQFAANDYKLLQSFRQQSSLATFLTILSRRIIIQAIQTQKRAESLNKATQVEASAYPEA